MMNLILQMVNALPVIAPLKSTQKGSFKLDAALFRNPVVKNRAVVQCKALRGLMETNILRLVSAFVERVWWKDVRVE